MNTLLNLTYKAASELAPGELFRVKLQGSNSASLAILLMRDSDHNDPVYGLLNGPAGFQPLEYFEGNGRDFCLSYGIDWLLEERPGPETAPGVTPTPAARLFFDSTGIIFQFQAPQGFIRQSMNFNITAKNVVPASAIVQPAPLASWAIWANLEHSRQPASKPLFEYPVPQLTGTNPA